jgi:hypothetical protein
MEENRTGGAVKMDFVKHTNSEREIGLQRSLYVYSALTNIQLWN